MKRILGRLGATLLLLCPTLGWGQLKPDEVVVFFPTAGWRSPDGSGWQVPVHAWVYEPEEDSVLRNTALSLFRRILGRDWSSAEAGRFRERARLLLVDNESGKRIRVRLGGSEQVVGTTHLDGQTETVLDLTGDEVLPESGLTGGVQAVTYRAVTRRGDARVFEGVSFLVPPAGMSVVSDLDDTIKVSNVTDRAELARNTFLREFRAVPGMAERYRELARRGVVFHYVTASPWQLYPAVREFLDAQGFPPGSLHMRPAHLANPDVTELFASSAEVKRPHLRFLLETYPKRRFLLIGDSGEEDPELYAQAALEHPEQVVAIRIRRVDGSPGQPRLEERLAEVPSGKWRGFFDGTDLELDWHDGER